MGESPRLDGEAGRECFFPAERLGLLGFGLAVLMIGLGVLTASDRLARHVAHPGADSVEEVRAFYAIPMADIFMFATLLYLGYRNRSHPVVLHRRMAELCDLGPDTHALVFLRRTRGGESGIAISSVLTFTWLRNAQTVDVPSGDQ